MVQSANRVFIMNATMADNLRSNIFLKYQGIVINGPYTIQPSLKVSNTIGDQWYGNKIF